MIDKKALAREACGCCVCKETHDNFDCHACFCGMTARPPYNCHAKRIERALTEWERVVREEDAEIAFPSGKEYATKAAFGEACQIARAIRARKPAEGEKSPLPPTHACGWVTSERCRCSLCEVNRCAACVEAR